MDILYPPLEVTVRTILGSFLFRGDDVFKKVSVLSGGEKSRLSLVKLLLNPPNLLLMDEPTIHLDMDSCEVLMDALEQYQGTLIFISHDVTFIRRLAQKVLHIHSGRITTYAGGYEYYLRKNQTLNERDGIVAGQGLVNAQPENSKEKNLLKSELSAKELKRLEIQRKAALSNRRRELRMLVNKLEREISKLEMQHTGLVDQLQDPSLYEDRAAVEDLNQKLISNREESEARNLDWEKAATELSEMEEQ
jgi:ATP-binding cassette subfamily F protein 3